MDKNTDHTQLFKIPEAKFYVRPIILKLTFKFQKSI